MSDMECHPQSLIDSQAPCCMGIDEAGRGPVLGPMVYGTCYCAVDAKARLAKMGFADSKQLTEAQRDNLFDKIKKSSSVSTSNQQTVEIGWMVEILEPESLSMDMLKINKVNLNLISHNAAINLIRRALEKKVNITEIFVDTVGPPEKYQAKLKQLFPGIQITVSKKADSLFPIVSAASICAKVTRDFRLRNWQFKETIPNVATKFGSGYPSDPATKAWLRSNSDPVFGFPSVIRFSWKTTTNVLNDSCVDVAWSGADEEDTQDGGQTKLTFSSKKQQDVESKRIDRYRFFSENNMEIVTDI